MAKDAPRGAKRTPKQPDPAQSGERIAYQGKRTTVRLQPVTHANGRTTDYEIVVRPDAAAVVALRLAADGTPEVALVRQRRPAVDRDLWEIPAGLVEPDERDAPERTAARELREETGFDAGAIQVLAAEYPSPGYTTEIIHLYLATDLRAANGGQRLDPGEDLSVLWLPLDEAMARCRNGEITDGKTFLGLWLARDELAGGSLAL